MNLIKSTIVKVVLFTTFLFIYARSYSQDGTPFLTNYFTEDPSLNENYSICHDKNGTLIIANRKGILTFDAEEWKLIKTPELPLVVASGNQGENIFVGCRNSIGYLQKNDKGEYEYSQILGQQAGTVMQIWFTTSRVYFLSHQVITSVNLNDYDDIKQIAAKSDNTFNYLFSLKDKIYVDIAGKGLSVIKDKLILPIDASGFSLSGKIVFGLAYNAGSVLLGSSDNKLYLFDGNSTKPFEVQDQAYLNDGTLADGKFIGNKIVLSTMSAGCLIIDKATGKTVYSINYMTGLPDDEILATGTDDNHGIWLAHYYGLTRVDASIPVKIFSSYKGLSGNLTSIEHYNNKLFVSTGNGIYFLEKKNDYVEYNVKETTTPKKEKSKEVNKKSSANPQKTELQAKAKPEPQPEASAPAPEKKKKGFFGLFKSKKSEEKQAASSASGIQQVVVKTSSSSQQSQVVEPEQKTGFLSRLFGKTEESTERKNERAVGGERKKAYQLKSVTHSFQKVPGFDHRCKSLFMFNGKLLAFATAGIFEIEEKKAVQIYKCEQVNSIYAVEKDNKIFACTDKGLIEVTWANGKWANQIFPAGQNENVFSFAHDVFDYYWLGCESKAIRVKMKGGAVKEVKSFIFPSEFRERVIVRISNKKPYFFLSGNIYSVFNDSVQKNAMLSKFTGTNTEFFYTQQEYTWIHNDRDWVCLKENSEPDSINLSFLNLFEKVNNLFVTKDHNLWIIDNNTLLYKINRDTLKNYKTNYSAFIKSFIGMEGEPFSLNGVSLNKDNRSLKIKISAPFFIKVNSNQYQYIIEGLMKEWSSWSSNPVIDLFVMNSGDYKIRVRARNIFGNTSDEKVLSFKIKPSFYETWWFMLLVIIALIGLVYLIIKYRERKLQQEKEILEQKVRERTAEIMMQKEEIEMQHNQIFQQKKEITDSIHYASRIQHAMLPAEKNITDYGLEFFVLYKPRDIVSGDFYWTTQDEDRLVIAAADCTGHGVPGAFMSMLGMAFLNQIQSENEPETPGAMLDELRNMIVKSLHQTGKEEETKDGMDISMCMIDKKKKALQYAGAYNSIYILRNGELIEASADRMPVGFHDKMDVPFTTQNIPLQKGDVIYMFSDGYVSQFGGEAGKKFMAKRFKELITSISQLTMEEQKQKLDDAIESWRGPLDQVDDLLVLGFKF